ncbi:MAG: Gfo/Idh/MocA family oxidoreductase [bacterium]|nr:Gfo/Idh/MocA family oxidoreductase [bacterium]MCP4964660.1 Gfo/Idh/MocA family oxidoreductase [bacterium]
MTLRVGIVGAGNMAATHAAGWNEAGDRVTHILATGSTRAGSLAADLGAELSDSYEELLAAVDVVDICSPTDTHLGYVEVAAASGVSVVCEKPLGRTAKEAQEAVAICEAAGVLLLVAHVVRFFPEYSVARDRVVAGELGDVATVRLDRSTYFPVGDGSWFGDHERSGGVVLDLMIHDVDYARWVAGDVERVYARRAEPTGSGGHVLATLRHRGGALSHVQGSWAFPEGSFRTSLEIAGSEGLLTLHASEPFSALVPESDDVSAVPQPPTTLAESPYVTQMKHFSAVLHGLADPIVSATDAAAAVEVCEAILQSIDTCQAVTLGGAS